jgi:hypothetical protein
MLHYANQRFGSPELQAELSCIVRRREGLGHNEKEQGTSKQ